MANLSIETNVPLPLDAGKNSGRMAIFPEMRELEPGHSFYCPPDHPNSHRLAKAVNNYNHNNKAIGKKLIFRSEGPGVRVWRLK